MSVSARKSCVVRVKIPTNPDNCRVLWIRHGETAWNTEKRFQGHLDIPLNDTGHRQASLLAARLATEYASGHAARPAVRAHVSHLYSSDLSRAAQTAGHIGTALDLRLNTLPGLRERNYGDLAGLTGDEMAAQFPSVYKGLSERQPDAELPGGESLRQFYERIIASARELVARHQGETICVVVHGGVLDCIYRQALGIALPQPRAWLLANASINIVDHGVARTGAPASDSVANHASRHGSDRAGDHTTKATEDRWQIVSWADTAHLSMQARDEVDGRIA